MLRQAGVDTFVSHSSLGLDERRQAEEAFAQRQNCVIVATSSLELGLDPVERRRHPGLRTRG
jgi:ATP-dependent helicase Lhr and Lhr-like helicase